MEATDNLDDAYRKGFLVKIKLMDMFLESDLCEIPENMFRQTYSTKKELAQFIIKTSKNNLILHSERIKHNIKLSTSAKIMQDLIYRRQEYSEKFDCEA